MTMKRLLATCLAAVLIASSAATLAGGFQHRGHGYPSRHHSFYRHHSNRGAYLVGGILLGSVLTHALFPRPAPEVVYIERRPLRSPRVVYEESTTVVRRPAGRQLVRDLGGNCFEQRFDRNGTELRSQIPATECDW
jgi:hypothetical protein